MLFVCKETDKEKLLARLDKSKIFDEGRVSVLSSSQSESADSEIEGATFLVAFANDTTVAPFIDNVIDKALVKKIGGVHVQNQPSSFIPSKVTAYRWRSMSWNELEAMFE